MHRAVSRPETPGRLAGLQSLRGLAAAMVLTGHALAEAGHYFGVSFRIAELPWTRGVDVFFVISGFIITLSARRFTGRPGAFMWRRVLRVVPLYYLFTTLMVLVLLVSPGAAKDTMLDPGQIISSYLFFPYERYDGRVAPVLSLGWTLNYEMLFYALTALALAMPRSMAVLAAAIVGLAALSIAPLTGTAIRFWSNPLILEFLFGIALARLYIGGYVLGSWWLAVGFVTAGLILMAGLHPVELPRFVAAGLPAALMVAGATVFWPAGFVGPGQILGDASYALYLSHRFTLRVLTFVLLPVLPAGAAGAAVYAVSAFAGSVGVAILVFRYVEQPVITRLSNKPARTGAIA